MAPNEWPFDPAIFGSDLFEADRVSAMEEALPKMNQAILHLRAKWLANP